MNCNQINNWQVLDSSLPECPLSRTVSCALFAKIYISFTVYLPEPIRPLELRWAQQNHLCVMLTTLLSQDKTDAVSKSTPLAGFELMLTA